MIHLIYIGFYERTTYNGTTKFKQPVSPEHQLGLTIYRLAYGCSYSTAADLFGVAEWHVERTVAYYI